MSLIDEILNSFERSKSSITGDLSGNTSYRVQDSLYRKMPKTTVTAEAKALEQEGLCRIRWVRGYYGTDVEKLEYAKSILPELYRRCGRTARYERISLFRKEVEAVLERVRLEWIRRYLNDLLADAERGKIIEDETFRKDLFQSFPALDELDARKEPVFHRIFSRMAFQDSKKFENNYQPEICRLARKYYPEAVTEEMSEKEVLEQLYIDDYSQELLLKGAVQIELDGKWADLSLFPYGVTLNAQTLKTVTGIRAADIHRVITIENKANYLAEQASDGTLVIFSHGYFSPLERNFLRQLANALPADAEYFHSGDLDYGGVCIFSYIRNRIFPKVQSYRMDAGLLEEYRRFGRTEPMDAGKVQKLAKLAERKEPGIQPLQPLIDYMLNHQVQMEQEEFLVSESVSIECESGAVKSNTGVGENNDIRIRLASEPDLSAIVSLMGEAARTMTRPEWFVADDAEYIAEHIAQEGFIMVAEAVAAASDGGDISDMTGTSGAGVVSAAASGGILTGKGSTQSSPVLAGFFMIDLPGESEKNLLLDVNPLATSTELEAAATMDSTAVAADWRGKGIQKMLLQAAETELLKRGYRYFLATVHPDNCYSLANFERAGYQVMVTKKKYGSSLRHILMKTGE